MAGIKDTMQIRLKAYKEELLNLKQAKKASTTSKYFSYTVNSTQTFNAWLITYEAGDQPIITEVLSYYDTSLSAPFGNQQYIFSFSQVSSEITVLSTRKIANVVGV